MQDTGCRGRGGRGGGGHHGGCRERGRDGGLVQGGRRDRGDRERETETEESEENAQGTPEESPGKVGWAPRGLSGGRGPGAMPPRPLLPHCVPHRLGHQIWGLDR